MTIRAHRPKERALQDHHVFANGLRIQLPADGHESELALVEDAGHVVRNEAPDEVIVVLQRWLGAPR